MPLNRHVSLALSIVAGVLLTAGFLEAAAPEFGPAEVTFCGEPAPPSSLPVCGFSLVAQGAGPQLALTAQPPTCIACVRQGEEVTMAVPMRGLAGPFAITARATALDGRDAEVGLSLGEGNARRATLQEGTVRLELPGTESADRATLRLTTMAGSGESAVLWQEVRLRMGGRWFDVPLAPAPLEIGEGPPPVLPAMRGPIERALIEWDWRMQDGIHTSRVPSTYADAIQRTLQRGDQLIRALQADGVPLRDEVVPWEQLRQESKQLSSAADAEPTRWENLWRRVHVLRRQIAFSNPLAAVGPLVFVKQVPGMFSHQLTQYEGNCARPGGGVFVLDAPGRSMQCRRLAADALPEGSYQHLDVSHDGGRILFSYCQVDKTPSDREVHGDHHYHLYEMTADGRRLRQLTDGPYDDFSPRYLPDGKILFVSTRRGGFHRCGRGPCPVYTLAVAEADGSNPHVISYHETHEWDPAVLYDGRVIYTRWDYVDRHAVHYEQLWSVRPDGSDVRIFYGNNTFNPVGVWEALPVPGSTRVMATAAAHHAMTAGSIILLDVTQGVDGLEPITRLTPDALFPESEAPVVRMGQDGRKGYWHAPVGVPAPPTVPPEAARWPGHCYRSPYPLSEEHFLAAYSFDALIGEPTGNPANMFGIYLVDCFGNKELVYRDLNIASLWPTPLRPRPRPSAVPSVCEPVGRPEGTFFVQDIYASWPAVPDGVVKRLRIVQVLPKSTPHINGPPVGIPNASPGKQVLGTVPVEPDGSACFRAPAGVPLSFQALDDLGRAVQIMRSLTYLQPGESCSCVGCHEPRTNAPPRGRVAQALCRPPSTIEPGPDGSNPLSYPILVQPLLDKHCVRCHSRAKPEGGVVLTAEPEGHYTVSYNALAPRVTYSAWGGRGGDFRQVNSEPLTRPGHFGARGSGLMELLLQGHEGVALNNEEIDRLATWMDANALFYGTFDPEDQARQRQGQRIEGPKIE